MKPKIYGRNETSVLKKKEVKPVEFVIGAVYDTNEDHRGGPFMLVQVNEKDSRTKYTLINLHNGNRWCDSMTEAQMRRKLSKDGFRKLPPGSEVTITSEVQRTSN